MSENNVTDIEKPRRARALYPVPEIAELCGVTERMIWGYVERGELRSVKLGRRRLIPADALEEFLARLNVPPSAIPGSAA